MITRRNSPLQNFNGSYHVQRKLPVIPVMNPTNTIQTSHPHFLKTYFCFIFKSVWSSTVSTITRIYTGRSGVQILTEARELYFHQNIQTIPSTHPASNSMTTTAFLWQ